jgi:cytochrome c
MRKQMKRMFVAATILAACFSARADVDAKKALSIANRSDCLSCHAVASKVIGPAYRDVAKKYKGDQNAAEALLQKVKNGGSGVWGKFPMPAHPNVADGDLKTVIDWILAGAPSD